MAGLPGVRVGPLDPDVTAEFGQVSKDKSARQLIKLHARMHPQELTRALVRPLDPERTKGLVMEEVRGYLAGLELDNGDPAVPEGAEVVGAQVRGPRDRTQTLTFTYRIPSGRTAKWYTDFDPAELPESADAGDQLVTAAEMKERGVVAFDSEGASTEILRRQVSGLRRERDALRAMVEGKSSGKPSKVETDVRPDVAIVGDNEDLRRQVQELMSRNQRLEGALDEQAKRKLQEGAQAAADRRDDGSGDGLTIEQEEPVEGYDDMNARDVIGLVKHEDTDPDVVEAILEYESHHANRRSVVGAATAVLDRTD